MRGAPHHLSIFSQNLDRVAFLVYFLGAVLPFAALAFTVQRYVLPQLPAGPWTFGAAGALGSLGCLSLAAFLALRRVTRSTLARLDADNRRLESLLDASRTLADARFEDDVHRTAARCAAAITAAAAAFVVAPDPEKEDGAPLLVAAAGDDAMDRYRAARARVDELVAPVLEHGAPSLWSDAAGSGAVALAAVAIPGPRPGAAGAALAVVSTGDPARFDAGHLRSLSTVAALAGVARVNADLRDAQRNFFVHVTELLIAALDAHQGEQSGHARRVAHLSIRLGRALGLEEQRLERLHFAALLHDVGMLKIDTRRPQAKSVYQTHPALGQRMLSRIRLWEDLAPFVLHHHEWWDGSGYPEGLAGEDIPLEARIIGIAEAFDSMTSPASYKARCTLAEALSQIREGRGTQFDPRLADRFLALAAEGVIEVPSEG
jgi:HD-GYP domain-containing protein (c-di-GMP phosphodiesterase class II)